MKKILVAILMSLGLIGNASADTPPNVIYILADDLGYGDLSCYGQTHFQTPNIDALAKQGMKFTQHYSGSTVCAPSRCALLTGKHIGHAVVRGNSEFMPEGQQPMPADNRHHGARVAERGLHDRPVWQVGPRRAGQRQ